MEQGQREVVIFIEGEIHRVSESVMHISLFTFYFCSMFLFLIVYPGKGVLLVVQRVPLLNGSIARCESSIVPRRCESCRNLCHFSPYFYRTRLLERQEPSTRVEVRLLTKFYHLPL